MLPDIWTIATNKEQTGESSSLFCLPLPLGILLKDKRLAKNDQSEPNLIEGWLIRCWRAFYLQGPDSASVSFLAQIITQVWRWLEDAVRWGHEVWSGDPVPWKGQIFEWNLNGMPYWDWTCFWVHKMDNVTFGSWSTRNWKDILHPKYLRVCVAFPCPRLEGVEFTVHF